MNAALETAVAVELEAARQARRLGDLEVAFRHLERAHILSQRLTARHVRVHIEMLSIGWARRDAREVFGQLARIVAAALISRLWVPSGNTGGANVSALKSMPIADDLAALLRNARR